MARSRRGCLQAVVVSLAPAGRVTRHPKHRRGTALARYGSATMTKARTWLDDRAALLVSLLAERHGLTVSVDIARQDISDDLDHVARLMRIGRQAAKVYITDDTISKMADRIAAAVAEDQSARAAITEPVIRVDVVDLDNERRRRRRTSRPSPRTRS